MEKSVDCEKISRIFSRSMSKNPLSRLAFVEKPVGFVENCGILQGVENPVTNG